MLKCLNCGCMMVAEYDSQVCPYCAGELHRPVHHWRRSVRHFFVRLKLLPVLKSRHEPLGY